MTDAKLQKDGEPEPVEYTISQDRGAGNSVQMEADYSLLTGTDFGPASPPAARTQPSVSNRTLQDYQMQLIILEQQNKKRLTMGWQELDRPLISHFDDFRTGTGRQDIDSKDQESTTDENSRNDQAIDEEIELVSDKQCGRVGDEENNQGVHCGTPNTLGGRKRDYDESEVGPGVEAPTESDPPIWGEGEAASDSESRLKRPKTSQGDVGSEHSRGLVRL